MTGLQNLVRIATESLIKLEEMMRTCAITQRDMDNLKKELAEELSLSIDFNLGDMQDPSIGFLKIINQEKYKPMFALIKDE